MAAATECTEAILAGIMTAAVVHMLYLPSLCLSCCRCQYWVREVSTGNCWRVHVEPAQPGVPIPPEWSYQRATGFQAGPSITKTSGVCAASSSQWLHIVHGGRAGLTSSLAECTRPFFCAAHNMKRHSRGFKRL
jgi:hypothetical protein